MVSAPAFLHNAADGPWMKHTSPSTPPVLCGHRTLHRIRPNPPPRIPAIRPGVLCVVCGRSWKATACNDPMLVTRTPYLEGNYLCDTFPSAFFLAFHRPHSVSPLSSVPRNPHLFPFLKSLRFPQRVRLVALAEGSGGGRGREDKEEEVEGKKGDAPPPAGNDEIRNALALDFRWRDLLNPDPENIVAVALTGLLVLASAQALWQLFFISIAIVLAALKYSFIAALLLFIVITLL